MVHADVVARLDADAVALEAPQTVLAEVFAGGPLEVLDAGQALGPRPMALVPLVRLLEEMGQPAALVLREVDAQCGEAVEHAGEHQLGRAEPAEPAELLVADLTDDPRAAAELRALGVLEQL